MQSNMACDTHRRRKTDWGTDRCGYPGTAACVCLFSKGTDREAKVEEVLRFLCKAKRIQLFVIRQKDPIALATEIKQAFAKANLFINSDSQRDVAHLRKRYFAQKNNGN